MPDGNAIEVYRLPDRSLVQETLKGISEFQRLVHSSLKEGHDYGVIPGTKKPTLFKPGAEKITSLCGVAPQYEIIDSSTDWDRGLFEYTIRCSLVSVASGTLIDSGIGECNSFESKYRYRWLWDNELSEHGIDPQEPGHRTKTTKSGKTQWRIENEDPADVRNTILKMAKKRALVDAALSIGSLSELFTQDIEDLQRDAARLTADEPGGSHPDERDASAPFCEKHEVSFDKHEKENRTWHSHRDGDGWCNYTQPAEAPDKGGRYWGKEAMEKLGMSLKAERPETFMADLKKIVGDNTGGVALRAFATSKDLKTAAALLKFILEEWHIDDDDKAQDSLPQGELVQEAVEAGEHAAATEGGAAHEEGDEEQVTDENLPW
jgi:hypothetical protein